jgi:hypothetical protein
MSERITLARITTVFRDVLDDDDIHLSRRRPPRTFPTGTAWPMCG